jgi:hypothetical protein
VVETEMGLSGLYRVCLGLRLPDCINMDSKKIKFSCFKGSYFLVSCRLKYPVVILDGLGVGVCGIELLECGTFDTHFENWRYRCHLLCLPPMCELIQFMLATDSFFE